MGDMGCVEEEEVSYVEKFNLGRPCWVGSSLFSSLLIFLVSLYWLFGIRVFYGLRASKEFETL